MNPFDDVAKFMQAGAQSVGRFSPTQTGLYLGLIEEEDNELISALERPLEDEDDDAEKVARLAEIIDALVDSMWVRIGALHSLGPVAEAAWAEVTRSNLSKVDPDSGMLLKREDGKVLKPAGYSPPNLIPMALESLKSMLAPTAEAA